MGSEVEGLSNVVIGAAIEVHKVLGPGLLERAYHEALKIEFNERGIRYEHELVIPTSYKGRRLNTPYRIDFLAENALVLEIKAVSRIEKVHIAQALTCLSLGDFAEGLILNFSAPLMKEGIQRLKKPIQRES